MNTVIMMGRLTDEPEVRATQDGLKIARYTLAVDRRFKREGKPTADFFSCTVFGNGAAFAENYLHKGTKIAIRGELQNNHYTDKNGTKHYSEQIIVDAQEFAESKKQTEEPKKDDFMEIPDGIAEQLPFV